MKHWLFSFLSEIIFPRNCLSCGHEGSYVCPECFTKISIQTSFHCYICHKRTPNGKTCPECRKEANSSLTGLLVASDWQNLLIRQLIYECKYRFIRELAQPMALILAKFLTINDLVVWSQPNAAQSYEPTNQKTDKLINRKAKKLILIPIPLHKRRLNWRGFNQAKIICDFLSEYFDIATVNNLIIREHHTSPQMDIKDKQERIKNVADVFKLNPAAKQDYLKGKIVFLIDDVCTTGATLNECAATLKELEPKQIWGLVIARG